LLLAVVTLASVGKVVTFLVMVSILVVLHEYGHFIVARRNGVRVNEFAVGLGPKIFGWTSPRSGTLYSLRALPIGGYCAMEGEDNKTSEAEQQRAFLNVGELKGSGSANFQAKTTWQRMAIVLAGPIMNFILCYAILLGGGLVFGVPSSKVDRAVVTQVMAGSPAAKNGLLPGDRIVSLSIDGAQLSDASKLVDNIHSSLGKHIEVTYARDDVQHTIHVVPEACPAPNPKGQGCIGFYPSAMYERVGFGTMLVYTNLEFLNIADQTFSSLGLLVTQFTRYAGQVSGIVGMGQVATTVQSFGWGPYLTLAATLSFALGLFNLLPIPALDGGRAAFILAEMLRGKPVDPEKEAIVHFVGFAALLALMAVVAYHDIVRIVSGHGVL
jgi:regulator of sigma E protease